MADLWNCSCGQQDNSGKFCINCGSKRPEPVLEVAEDTPVAATPVEAVPVEAVPVVAAPLQAQPYNPAPQVQQQTPYGYGYNNPAPQQYVNVAPNPPVQQKTSSASLVLGIFSILCICIQPLGAILAIIGLINSRKGGTGGKVTSIIGLILGLIFLVIDLLVAYTILTAK